MRSGRGLTLSILSLVLILMSGTTACAQTAVPPTTALPPVQLAPPHTGPRVVGRTQRPPLQTPPRPTDLDAVDQDQTAPPPPPPIVMRAAPPPQASLWPDGVIPLCFEDSDPENAGARDQIHAAAATWEAAADVHFDFAETCGQPGRVPIRIVRDPEMFASSSHLGNSLKDGGQITLNAEYLVTNRLCGPRGTIGEQRCFYADALHELGHALGFSHDHVSANAPDCLARTTTPEAVEAGETYYDPISIMNYCNANRFYGFLSAADECSVKAAYGVIDGDRPRRSDCYALVNAAYPST